MFSPPRETWPLGVVEPFPKVLAASPSTPEVLANDPDVSINDREISFNEESTACAEPRIDCRESLTPATWRGIGFNAVSMSLSAELIPRM